jgi:hypothetical protein
MDSSEDKEVYLFDAHKFVPASELRLAHDDRNDPDFFDASAAQDDDWEYGKEGGNYKGLLDDFLNNRAIPELNKRGADKVSYNPN